MEGRVTEKTTEDYVRDYFDFATRVAMGYARRHYILEHEDDCLSAAYFGLWKAARVHDRVAEAAFTTYAYTAIVNEIRMYMRRARRVAAGDAVEKRKHAINSVNETRRFEDDFDTGRDIYLQGYTYDLPHHSNVERKIFASQVMGLLDTLPLRERTVFEMHYLQEMTMQETARKLKMTFPAVKTMIFRTRAELQEKWRRFEGRRNVAAYAPYLKAA